MVLLILFCLVMAVIGSALPILQGWVFLVLALYLFAMEFATGRRWVKAARRRWPRLSVWIGKAHEHRWAPKFLRKFDELTDPSR